MGGMGGMGHERLTGWCAGADWVRPISPVELYTYGRSIAISTRSRRPM